MQHSLHFDSQFCSSKFLLLRNPLCNLNIMHFQTHVLLSKPSLCQSLHLHSLSSQTQIQNVVICARKRKGVSGYQKIRTILPQLLSFLASNSQILPESLSLAIAEFGGENGGGLGLLKGFKREIFDSWKRKKKINFGFYGVLGIPNLLLFLLFGREFKSEVVIIGVLVLSSFGALLTRKYKRRVKDFVLGICFVVALVVLGLRREDMQKCVQRIAVSSPILKLVKTTKRNGRRLF